MTLDSIPQARVVRHAGQLVAPPPLPRAPRSAEPGWLHTALIYAVGLWPLEQERGLRGVVRAA
jgi:hypothetical protein